jgi:Flp pilus assembly protein TadD
LPTIFRQQFEVDGVSTVATVHVRALRRFQLIINGAHVGSSPAGDNWKNTSTFDVAPYLRPGMNQVQVQVINDLGPPALWLMIKSGGGDLLLASDTTWQVAMAGSHWLKVRAASEYPKGGTIDPQRPPMRVSEVWPTTLLIVLLLGCAGVWGARRIRADRLSIGFMILLTIIAWSAMFFNNAGSLHQSIGYDSAAHLSYIQYLLDHHELPLVDQGFETNQPPLYYVLSAVALGVCGLETADSSGVYVLRAIGMAAGVTHVTMILLMLGLVFPDHRRRVLIGWVIAATLPVHLYLFQYVTNEGLFAALASVALYLAMRMVTHGLYSWRDVMTLGAVLGALLLTKLTAALVIGVVAVMIGWSLVQRKQRHIGAWLHAVAAPVVIAVVIGGWHYYRTWLQTGTAFVTANDSHSGYIWWQDPGYSTPGFYLRFGEAIREPFYSGFSSFADGVYSTLFGDAMFAAVATYTAPGWNYTLMMTCYVLSLLPAIALVVGVTACFRKMLKEPGVIHVVLLAMPVLMLAAMLMFSLRVANYGCSKVFYGLCAAGPCCVLTAWGLDVLMRRGRAWCMIVSVLLMAWVLSAYGAFWIIKSSPRTMINMAATAVRTGQTDQAVTLLKRAVESEPANKDARLGLITLLAQQGHEHDALSKARDLLAQIPNDSDAHWAVSWVLDRMSQHDQAIDHVQRAVEITPQHPKALLLLAILLDRSGQVDQAIDVYRRTLMRDPDDRFTHKALARLYVKVGQQDAAQFHTNIARMMDDRIGYSPWSH